MISIHRGPSMRQRMNPILDRLKYFPNHLFITLKITQMSHKEFQLKSRGTLKSY